MADINQTNLKEPERLDWDVAFAGSKYSAPPQALDQNGKPIIYSVKASEIKETDADQGYLNFQADLEFVNGASGRVRTWMSTRPFMRKNNETGELEPMKGNPNKVASFLRSAGLQVKPQSNADYRAAVKAVNGKPIPLTIDWEGSNKETGEKIKGYLAFPLDPATGFRKSILKKGDTYYQVDNKGNVTGTGTVQSEVIFANARVKYFQDASKASR